ncbi:cation acetate symporter [Rhodopirellula sp. MGV]|uniref:sodium/solute symporter n=1 Tax=Rhodopirellula sp. MGV TaxID=2023130 RepID=UPI000B96D33E|nr:cation acetate symporter [Rhodopirellula sp. MGV]OYP34721.1 cation acetate symporter [Rhodopirellula sp. MGV]PNY34324.1 cation acetate symporter [Rhodopirellula baltica]
MIYDPSWVAVFVFFGFVGATVGLSFFLGRKAKSSEGYFAAHGQIPWAVNGIAFAGDYLSAASFLGICGMIASYGYDGFLYSIGFLAGWIVALFVIAEPMKRLGRFTFADALDSKFDSRGIKAAAGISTLVVSVFYLIPQMVGAGSLIQPLLGFPHWVGVVLVGVVVITIVVTAGMVSTTWVQFLKGSLLVIFSAILVFLLLGRGFKAQPEAFEEIGPMAEADVSAEIIDGRQVLPAEDGWEEHPDLIRLADANGHGFDLFQVQPARLEGLVVLRKAQAIRKTDDAILIDGAPKGRDEGQKQIQPVGTIQVLPEGKEETGGLGLVSFFTTLNDSRVVLWRNKTVTHADGTKTTVHFQKLTDGKEVLRPGEHPKFAGIRGDSIIGKLNFLSLMLALFCGTASLPHILIRYYTVKDGAAARKSTIVGIASIGFFYVLTLYIGLGAMTSGSMDLTDSNMAAPLLARSISTWLFAIISAIAFTTVLGTVSGLILASSGAVAHDLLVGVMGINLSEDKKVRIAKLSAVVVGAIAIVLGILFKEMNVGYLVGWAFSVAASANLPALVMLLFWKGTSKQGIVASVMVGMISSLGWILLSSDTYKSVYGWDPETAIAPFSQPGIITIPLAFVTLVVVSLLTKPAGSPELSTD